MTHQEIISRYEKGDCKDINELFLWIKTADLKTRQPTSYRKGDVFILHDGFKKRPFVLYKKKKDCYILIPLTTTKDEMHIGSYKSRFLRDGFFSITIKAAKQNHLEDNFICVFEDMKALNNAYKSIIEFLK